jgi:rubredoxin
MNFVDVSTVVDSALAFGHVPAESECPTCGSGKTELFHEVENVPTNSCILFETREDALNCDKGAIALRFCHECGFIYNSKFRQDLTEYSGRYEETQGFSPTFTRFHRKLAEEVIERHGLTNQDVMEIGCGKGEFLLLLSQIGENRGVGVDPSALPERLKGEPGAERVTLIPEYFEPRHCETQPDFLCCKMTLEHITQTSKFIETVRAGLDESKRTIVFFQVPETDRIIRTCAFEDIYHEHCSYFTEHSLRYLFSRNRFQVTRTAIEYDDQYLTIEAVPAAEQPATVAGGEVERLASLVRQFPERLVLHKQHWRDTVQQAKADGKKVVLWGSGSKAVSFLTSLGIADSIDFVTDINPNRHNHFMPGTGHLIVPPERLAEIDPGLVIVMNRIYEDEISQSLRDMDVSCAVTCL